MALGLCLGFGRRKGRRGGAASSNFNLLTEAGNNFITESGAPIVLEAAP